MSQKLANAKALYMEGIRDGKPYEAVTKYTGARYTQHSTGVADGVDGFVSFFTDFIQRNPVRDIQIVRGLVDGQYVFVQAFQNINNGEAKWVTMDLFDTDQDDKIIEHWDVIAPFQSESVSGHSQIDGPTEVADLHATQDNKAVVRSFVDEVLIKDEWDDLSLYISSTTFTQHNPDIPDGLEGLKAYRAQLAAEGKAVQYQSLFKLIGQGNFVATYGKTIHGKDSLAVFDLYRLENGLIVEHWDNKEVILPASQWGNSGKF